MFAFRSLTSSSGVTSTWRKDLRRRSKRFVLCLLCDHIAHVKVKFCNFIQIQMLCLNQNQHKGLYMYMCALWQLLLFLKGFTESERNKLAMLTGILLANGNISASILSSLFNENLVKEGMHFSTSHACLLMLLCGLADVFCRYKHLNWDEICRSKKGIKYLFIDFFIL